MSEEPVTTGSSPTRRRLDRTTKGLEPVRQRERRRVPRPNNPYRRWAQEPVLTRMGVPTVSIDSTTMIVGLDVSKEYVDFFVLNSKGDPSGRRPRRAEDLTMRSEERRVGERV